MTAAIVPTVFTPPNLPPCETSALLNLLIVDEDRLVREACREAATALGYRTSTSQSAEQALWLIDSQTIDVVLFDLNLPDAGSSIDVPISRSLSSVAMPPSIRQCWR